MRQSRAKVCNDTGSYRPSLADQRKSTAAQVGRHRGQKGAIRSGCIAPSLADQRSANARQERDNSARRKGLTGGQSVRPSLADQRERTAQKVAKHREQKRALQSSGNAQSEPPALACEADPRIDPQRGGPKSAKRTFRPSFPRHCGARWCGLGLGRCRCSALAAPTHWRGRASSCVRCPIFRTPNLPRPSAVRSGGQD